MRFSKSPKAELKLRNPNRAWKLLPDIWGLIKPRRGILAIGFVRMAVNRASGLILRGSAKYFYDGALTNHRIHLLLPIVLIVVGATLIQALTSFALTQLLSKSSQSMVSELRSKVQAHMGRLPISFYDANKTGALVSRIMSDIEGVRNLIDTGLFEFAGGMMTAVFAMVYLFRTSVMMTGMVFAVLLIFGIGVNKAFKTTRPIFRARQQINAEVTGRLLTVRHAHQILMIEGGRIVERGTRESLCAAGERYYDLYTKQHDASGEGSSDGSGIGAAESETNLSHNVTSRGTLIPIR